MGSAVEAESLVKTYANGRKASRIRALDGLSFAVEAGSVFALVGPNGAGKSTAVKILTTLAQPDEGRAVVAGHNVTRQPAAVRRAIGCVAQRSGADRDATGRENLILQGCMYGVEKAVLRERAARLLDRFGLSDVGDRMVRTYSGGMQRRLDVAMGLVHEPQVLFLDEPTTGLDPEARSEMWKEIERLTGEGLTIVLTTHYLEEADRLAARVAVVDRGRVVVEGSPEQLKDEMHGDALFVSLDGDGRRAITRDVVLAALAPLSGVRESVLNDCLLHARADDGARAVPVVLQALEAAGLAVRGVTVARPSLDDVYLRYAGRTFESAESEHGEAAR